MHNHAFEPGQRHHPDNEWGAQLYLVRECLASKTPFQAWQEAEKLVLITTRWFQPDDLRWVVTHVTSGEAAFAGQRFSLAVDYYDKALGVIDRSGCTNNDLLCDTLRRAIDLAVHAQESVLGLQYCQRLEERASNGVSPVPVLMAIVEFRRAFLLSNNMRDLTPEAKSALERSFAVLDEHGSAFDEAVFTELKEQIGLLTRAHRPDLLAKAQERAIGYLSSVQTSEWFVADWHLELMSIKIEQLDELLKLGEAETVIKKCQEIMSALETDGLVSPEMEPLIRYAARARAADAFGQLGKIDQALQELMIGLEDSELHSPARFSNVMVLQLKAVSLCLQEGRTRRAGELLEDVKERLDEWLTLFPELASSLEQDDEQLVADLASFLGQRSLLEKDVIVEPVLKCCASYHHMMTLERSLVADTESANYHSEKARILARAMGISREELARMNLGAASVLVHSESVDGVQELVDDAEGNSLASAYRASPVFVARVYEARAELELREGNLDEALKLATAAQDAVREMPDKAIRALRVAFHLLRGRILHAREQFEDACEEVTKGKVILEETNRNYHPLMASIQDVLGVSLEALGDHDAASEAQEAANAIRYYLAELNDPNRE